MAGPKVQVAVLLDEYDLARLDRIAERHRSTRSAELRRLVAERLDADAKYEAVAA